MAHRCEAADERAVATLPPLSAGFWPVPAGHLAAVVTHLEMTAPPAPQAVPTLERPLVLERLDPADLRGYRALFRAVGEPWLWFSRLRLTDAALHAILADARVEAYAVVDGEARVGLLELDFREPAQCELAFFGLVASHTGIGAGRWLMQEALTRAWARDIRRCHVHTCTLDHPAAVPFYLRSGFTPYRLEVEVTPDPRLTGDLPMYTGAQAPVVAGSRPTP